MLGAIILTGGGSSRMGSDKAAVLWRDYRAVDWVFRLARACECKMIVTVGPLSYGYGHVFEPGGGPVGGIVAGVETLKVAGCDCALVLAVDAPTIQAEDLKPLLGRPSGAAFDRLPLPMLLPFAKLPADAKADWPMARLVERAGLTIVRPQQDAIPRLRGANTAQERANLLPTMKP